MLDNNAGNKDFYFSIVIAVYNVENYLEEAIQSIIGQTMDFEKHIQLVLVNDGSEDNSRLICEKYKKMYPDNVIFIDKENGGVSSARNAGLNVIKGKYVNFLDSDDKLSKNTLEEVYKFFETTGKNIDVVSIPIYWFDQAKGKHLLNYKFNKSRIINILKEHRSIQMSASSSFVRRSAIRDHRFNEKLKYGEDAQWLNYIILDKCEYGVVKNAKYLYRKRSTETSATQHSLKDEDYFLSSLENFSFGLINISLEKLGFVPKYIQYMVMYDLQWRLNNTELLDPNHKKLFKDKLKELLTFISDDIILSQGNLNLQRKNYLIAMKYGKSEGEFYQEFISPTDAILLYKDKVMDVMTNHRLAIELIRIENDQLYIEGHFNSLFNIEDIKIFVDYNQNMQEAEYLDRFYKDITIFEKVFKSIGFKFVVPLQNVKDKEQRLNFYASYKGSLIKLGLLFASKSYITNKLTSYYTKENYILFFNSKNEELIIEPYSLKNVIKKEMKVAKYLYNLNKIGSRKAIMVRTWYLLRKIFKKKPIWLFMDRVNKADDNAEVLFDYATKQNDGIDKYFIINKDSPDFNRLKRVGKVIPYGSRKHKMYMLLASKFISSHADEFVLNPFGKMKRYYRDLLDFDYIFLQHGITKDDISDWLNKYKKNIRLFITAANKEYESIVNGNYNYAENEVVLSGFPRFDRLKNDDKKRILIMPTWRSNLVAKLNPLTGKRSYNPLFKESEFYHAFNSLLNNEKLISAAKKYGYRIVFFPHPNIVQQLKDYQIDPSIEVANINSSYRDHFNQSSVLVTDYSSVAFDFAYLKKPVIYFQFEANHLEQGYFDYKKMGFGEVLSDATEVAEKIIKYMENDCIMEQKYIERVNQFYAFTDNKNCERVYNSIINIDG
jgi:CDP-glycerol glycerophosphotransferase (TagB/SpsB family)/glycosyltransferase involved in cell wall biosynthesis